MNFDTLWLCLTFINAKIWLCCVYSEWVARFNSQRKQIQFVFTSRIRLWSLPYSFQQIKNDDERFNKISSQLILIRCVDCFGALLTSFLIIASDYIFCSKVCFILHSFKKQNGWIEFEKLYCSSILVSQWKISTIFASA